MTQPKTGFQKTGEASLSGDLKHRYRLSRPLAPIAYSPSGDHDRVLFVMLNPSTADASADDPTIRKCTGFASRWGYRSLEVVNLFSLRATKPAVLWASSERNRVPDSLDAITHAVADCDRVVVAWGAQRQARKRAVEIERHLRACLVALGRPQRLWCIGEVCYDGSPPHPLMLAYARELVPWHAEAEVAP